MNIVEKLERKWRDVAALFYLQRRWISRLSDKVQDLKVATDPQLDYDASLAAELISDLEWLTENLESNADKILETLGG